MSQSICYNLNNNDVDLSGGVPCALHFIVSSTLRPRFDFRPGHCGKFYTVSGLSVYDIVVSDSHNTNRLATYFCIRTRRVVLSNLFI